MISLTDLAVQLTICPFCGAQPGHHCVTRVPAARGLSRAAALQLPTTGVSRFSHKARTRPLTEAYWAGITDGSTTS